MFNLMKNHDTPLPLLFSIKYLSWSTKVTWHANIHFESISETSIKLVSNLLNDDKIRCELLQHYLCHISRNCIKSVKVDEKQQNHRHFKSWPAYFVLMLRGMFLQAHPL